MTSFAAYPSGITLMVAHRAETAVKSKSPFEAILPGISYPFLKGMVISLGLSPRSGSLCFALASSSSTSPCFCRGLFETLSTIKDPVSQGNFTFPQQATTIGGNWLLSHLYLCLTTFRLFM